VALLITGKVKVLLTSAAIFAVQGLESLFWTAHFPQPDG
jgi:hypothetical protein